MTESRHIGIHIPVLTRVEGEGALDLEISDGAIKQLQLRIFEPPRLFEKFLEQHEPDQVIDMVARICGICPVAYQVTAAQAFEKLSGIEASAWIRDMRRAMYCGEWIQSHALHIHLLAAPDYFGFDSAIEMAQTYPDEVKRGLRLQTLGNDLISLFGGRSVHPVGLKVGGFYKAPDEAAVQAIHQRLKLALTDAQALLYWVADIAMPDDHQIFTSVAMKHPQTYAIDTGRLHSDQGLAIDSSEFDRHFREFQVPYSTALHASLDGKPYLTGPLARMNLNAQQLPEPVQRLMDEISISFPSRNMFHSMLARAVELYYALHEAHRLLTDYVMPDTSSEAFSIKPGLTSACTEAPRGVLWHQYRVNAEGLLQHARIVPPTSQNQARMEHDIRQSLESMGLDQDEQTLRLRAEQVIRNYDPCISCATHFLTLNVKR